MKKNIIVVIVHNYRIIEVNLRWLENSANRFIVRHFFNPKDAKMFLENKKEQIYCTILDQAHIDEEEKNRYQSYLQLKEGLLKGINVIVTGLLINSNNPGDITKESSLKDKDVFLEWNEIFGEPGATMWRTRNLFTEK